MANTLTGLIPTIYAALDVVSREMIGFIPNVQRDATAESGAVGQTVTSPVTPANALEDITPGADPAESGDQTIGSVDVQITKSKAYPIRWSGEEQLAVTANGTVNTILRDQFTQGFRTLANAVEADLAALYVHAARAAGSAGTTPFATADNHTDFAEANRVLDEAGAPQGDRVMIVGSAARAKLEGVQSSLFKVNEAGDQGALLRDRQMRMLHSFTLGFSAGIKSHTPGTATGYLVNTGTPYAAGDTEIAVDTGSGTHLAGDIITFAGDDTQYVVGTDATGTGAKTLSLNGTGLDAALLDGTEVTTAGAYTANLFFTRNAMLLAARQPAMPEGGDAADDMMTVTDPLSGLTFQVAMYRQYRRVKYEIGLAWGAAMVKQEHAGILLG